MLIEYESDPPPFGLNEVLNQWEDWVPSRAGPDDFPEPTYTHIEAGLLVKVYDAWDSFCNATPQTIADEPAALNTRQWSALVATGRSALGVLGKRGRLSEEDEIQGA